MQTDPYSADRDSPPVAPGTEGGPLQEVILLSMSISNASIAAVISSFEQRSLRALLWVAADSPTARHKGGRGRDFPDFMYLVFEALISVYASARQVEAELTRWSGS